MNKYIIEKRHIRHTERKIRKIIRYDTPKERAIKKLANDYKKLVYKITGTVEAEE